MPGNTCKEKARIDYPCRWLYKVIGRDEEKIRQAVAEVVRERECRISRSNSSRTGKYHCLNVELTVQSEADRTAHHFALKNHPAVTMVL